MCYSGQLDYKKLSHYANCSLCQYFSEIFPYLVVVVGLENILVITKSVVSTPVHLEVKIRVAQGRLHLLLGAGALFISSL